MARSRRALSTLRNSMIDCSKVHVRPDRHGGLGAFAACNIASGEALTHARGSSNRSSNRHTSTIVDHTSNTPMCSLQSPLIMTVAAAQVVEKGVARVLTNVDGNENPCAAPARPLPSTHSRLHSQWLHLPGQVRLHLVGRGAASGTSETPPAATGTFKTPPSPLRCQTSTGPSAAAARPFTTPAGTRRRAPPPPPTTYAPTSSPSLSLSPPHRPTRSSSATSTRTPSRSSPPGTSRRATS